MARKQIGDCTKHNLVLCPQAKEIVLIEQAKGKKFKVSENISQAVNKIIIEYSELKKLFIIKNH
jgi:hypothetical protein